MAGSKAGAAKREATLKQKYGEDYAAVMKQWGAKGAEATRQKLGRHPFEDVELAKAARAKHQ